MVPFLTPANPTCLQVRRLTLDYEDDPAWSLQVLQAAAASVEELRVAHVDSEHLLAVQAMPGLRRLQLRGGLTSMDRVHSELAALAAPSRLEWLSVSDLPRGVVRSLLRAHAASLKTLLLWVGPPGMAAWPDSGNDLDAMLAGCGLTQLDYVELCREEDRCGSGCGAQKKAVRRAIPAVDVQCDFCDSADDEYF